MIPNQPKNRSIQIRYIALAALIIITLLPLGGIGFSSCPSSWLFGISCPACGLTRSMSALIHLDPAGSFYFHPLGWLIFLWLTGVVLTNDSRPLDKSSSPLVKQFNSSLDFKALAILFILVWLIRIWFYGRLNFI